MTENAPVLKTVENHIGFITLNREAERNTFTPEFAQLLNAYLMEMDDDDDVRVIVIRAAGKHFSTGISLDEFKGKSHGEYRALIRQMDAHSHTIARMKKPVIASARGFVIANGAGLLFASDMAVVSEKARFGTTAITVGLICLGPAVPLSRLVSRKRLLEMVLTGDVFTAKDALEMGLVNRVVPDDQLEAATLELATKLAAKSPLAMECGKQGIYAMSDLPYHQALDYMGELFASLCATQDAREGLDAFAEKRIPAWKRK